MQQLIKKRIGLESFVEKLDMVSKHDLYTLAAQKPQLRFPSADVMMVDYEFTALFKQLEGKMRVLQSWRILTGQLPGGDMGRMGWLVGCWKCDLPSALASVQDF